MRFVYALLIFAVVTTLAGCGGQSGPAEPAQLTAEQEQQQKEAQRQANAEERSHVAEQSGVRAPTAAEEERMHRGR